MGEALLQREGEVLEGVGVEDRVRPLIEEAAYTEEAELRTEPQELPERENPSWTTVFLSQYAPASVAAEFPFAFSAPPVLLCWVHSEADAEQQDLHLDC